MLVSVLTGHRYLLLSDRFTDAVCLSPKFNRVKPVPGHGDGHRHGPRRSDTPALAESETMGGAQWLAPEWV